MDPLTIVFGVVSALSAIASVAAAISSNRSAASANVIAASDPIVNMVVLLIQEEIRRVLRESAMVKNLFTVAHRSREAKKKACRDLQEIRQESIRELEVINTLFPASAKIAYDLRVKMLDLDSFEQNNELDFDGDQAKKVLLNHHNLRLEYFEELKQLVSRLSAPERAGIAGRDVPKQLTP